HAWRALLAELGTEPAHPEHWRLTIGRPSEEAIPLLLGRRVGGGGGGGPPPPPPQARSLPGARAERAGAGARRARVPPLAGAAPRAARGWHLRLSLGGGAAARRPRPPALLRRGGHRRRRDAWQARSGGLDAGGPAAQGDARPLRGLRGRAGRRAGRSRRRHARHRRHHRAHGRRAAGRRRRPYHSRLPGSRVEQHRPPVSTSGFWDGLYAEGQDGWELGAPAPALESWLDSGGTFEAPRLSPAGGGGGGRLWVPPQQKRPSP